VTLRVERDSWAEELDGQVVFDCAGPPDLHRTVHLAEAGRLADRATVPRLAV